MASEADRQFIKKFQPVYDLVRAGKIKGIQLRFWEKPGQTIASTKGGRK